MAVQPVSSSNVKEKSPTTINLPNDDQPILQLWDGGNVFMQPKKVLIIALWTDGKVVSLVDGKGNCILQFATFLDIPKTPVKVGRIDTKCVSDIMQKISCAGFFETSKYAGGVRSDGPNVILYARDATRTNELQHEAVEDAAMHTMMKYSSRGLGFLSMWDLAMDALRTIRVQSWRPVDSKENIVIEVPWKIK